MRALAVFLVVLGVTSALSHGHLARSRAEARAKAGVLPISKSNFNRPLSYALPKYTPGDACGTKGKCADCLINQVCVWLPFHNRCVEDRDPEHVYGTMQCGTWTPDELPQVTNGHDDYKLFHERKDPRDFNIASLSGGQDQYGLAVDMEKSDANDPDRALATGGGGEIIAGQTHQGFTGNLLHHDKSGKMLPIGVKGVESCGCELGKDMLKNNPNQPSAAKGCDCGYQEM